VTIAELMRELENYDPDTEVRLMEQPSWPFEYEVSHIWAPSMPGDGDETTCVECEETLRFHDGLWAHRDLDEHDPQVDESLWPEFRPAGADAAVVYLVEGSQLAYGTKEA
jgi:hypothetical protein